MKVVSLAEVQGDSEHGGKAAQLGAALRAGLPVPPGFAIAHAHVSAIASGGALERDVEAALAALGGPVAVRSSAVGEDGASASFAGQHATVLGVTDPASFLAALRTVYASARAPAALGYRERMKLEGSPRMGVVVQRLIDADTAGVLFTQNPMTGADERVIEATWGLGEAVVGGLVTPDHYRVSREGEVMERIPGEKDLAIRRRPDGGTEEVAVAGPRIAELCLGDGELAALHQLAKRCEAHAPGPQDLEWAFAAGELFLLQRRAITGRN